LEGQEKLKKLNEQRLSMLEDIRFSKITEDRQSIAKFK